MTQELKYAIALTQVENIGASLARKLVSHFGSAQSVFEAKRSDFRHLRGRAQNLFRQVERYDGFDRVDRALKFIENNNVRPLIYGTDGYPKRLMHCNDAPLVLYTRGEVELNAPKMVAVVGTRSASGYGKEMAAGLIAGLKKHNATILSGLAYGIDIAAHKAAIEEGLQTIAVLGHGLDRIYPGHHRGTANKMQEHGGLATEFLENTKPDRENFPKRNRIIAGLCDAVIVVESKAKGGAIITADLAESYNRDVFAVPGKIGDVVSEGCNRLIKSHRAALIESVKDLEYIMGWKADGHKPEQTQTQLFVELSPEEEKVVNLLNDKQKLNIDQICMELGVSSSSMVSMLLNLELSGLIKSMPGKMYALSNSVAARPN